MLIITKDLFYCIEIEKIPSFIVNNNNSVIETIIINDLCYKQIIDIEINYWFKYFFSRNDNEYDIYYYDIKYGVMKEYISEKKLFALHIQFY